MFETGFNKPCGDSLGNGKLMLYTYIWRYYCLETGNFLLNVEKPLLFQTKTQVVTAKKFQNRGFQKSRSLCISTFPQGSLMFPKPCYTNVWGGWAPQGWTLRISPLLAPGSPEVRYLKTENREAELARSHTPGSRAACSQLTIALCLVKLAGSHTCLLSRQLYSIFAKTSSHKALQFW